jgi:hypothetical protein
MNLDGFDKLGLLIGLLLALVLLFSPLAIVWVYEFTTPPVSGGGSAEATVGIAVIVRAAARRVLTTTVSTLLRTAFATFSRTAARTVMRRLMRFLVRALFGVLTREATWTMAGNSPDTIPAAAERRHPSIPLSIGVVALSLSFYGVVWVTRTEYAVTDEGRISIITASILAGIPLLVYGLIHLFVAKLQGVALRFNTAFDGLLLQAYFTGAGSFLPMTTDVEYQGGQREKMWLATISLVSMYGIHIGLWLLAMLTGSSAISFASGAFLIFCFVYVFPIKPLEGYDVWVENRWLWLAIWLPVLFSFFVSLPESLTAIL